MGFSEAQLVLYRGCFNCEVLTGLEGQEICAGVKPGPGLWRTEVTDVGLKQLNIGFISNSGNLIGTDKLGLLCIAGRGLQERRREQSSDKHLNLIRQLARVYFRKLAAIDQSDPGAVSMAPEAVSPSLSFIVILPDCRSPSLSLFLLVNLAVNDLRELWPAASGPAPTVSQHLDPLSACLGIYPASRRG